jgi:hypothetical protein
MYKIMNLIFFSFFQVGCSLFGVQREENPKYEVLIKDEKKEIRNYSSYIVATTWVEGDFKDAQGSAFRVLADYIFGNNITQEKISMTAPVVQSPQGDNKNSEKIAMTAPVIQSPSQNGWRMSFMMPSKYTLKDIPKPNDPRVELVEVPPKTMAVISFTGFWNEKKNSSKAEELKKWLSELKQYEIKSEPMFAGYNPPWTLPFLRRNEMMIEVQPLAK